MSTVIANGLLLHYDCDATRLPADLRPCFIGLEYDDTARQFVADAIARPHGRMRLRAYGFLRSFMSDYNAYGLLGMYPMHVLSTVQWRRLLTPWLEATAAHNDHPRLLDVGAGAGGVTAQLAPLFESVSVTEASRALRTRLRTRGYRVIQQDVSAQALLNDERFDVVSALNVIDRCARPRTLLANLHTAVREHGRLLLAVPLPLRPAVYVGAHTVDPDEPLPKPEKRWEDGVTSLVRELIEPAGFRVERLSRVPYLCRGESKQPVYQLDDAVMVCTRA